MLPKVAIIIPHKNRHELLIEQLEQLKYQSSNGFETIVVDDGSDTLFDKYLDEKYTLDYPHVLYTENKKSGPAAARNQGASETSADVLLFLGSDCIPDRNLIYRHAAAYMDSSVESVQGYTPFHPQVMDTPFMHYMDKTGLQAAWNNLLADGQWRKEANGFCLTTNFSIRRTLFENVGGFCERFPAAAWEDVELGYRLSQAGHKTIFDPSAINFHWHKYDIDSFAQRCYMEGRNRVHLCVEQPQMAIHLLPPGGLRALREHSPQELLEYARQYLYLINPTKEIEKVAQGAITDAMMLFSMQGALDSLIEYSPVLWAMEHVHKPEVQIQIMSAMKAIEQDNIGYAIHCYEWALQEQPDNWALYAFKGEILLLAGDKDNARDAFRKAATIAPGAEWPKPRLQGS